MAYKRYAKKNGKVYGPYYYESYRGEGGVKKIYIGQKPSSTSFVLHSKIAPFAIGFVILAVLIGLAFFIGQTGNVTLQTQPSSTSEGFLSGQATIVLEDGDSIQKDAPVKLTILKDGNIISETTKTIEEFLGNQVNYVQVGGSVSCVNETISSIQEVCNEEVVDNFNIYSGYS